MNPTTIKNIAAKRIRKLPNCTEFTPFKPNYINPFPIPKFISENAESSIVYYVDKIIKLKCQEQFLSTIEYEHKIDEIVYSLYELTDNEIELIKQTTNR